MRNAFVKEITHLAATDSRLFLITGDLGFGVLTAFAEAFPDQYLNAGVAEQNMTGLATGLALTGRTVFTYSIGNFCTLRCLEQIRNDACYHDANVKVISVGGGFSYGALGISHHATEDLSIMRALPNITVVAPCDLWEATEATKSLVNTHGTCYMRIDKSNAPDNHFPDEVFQLGKARIIREGDDCTLVASGGIMAEVIKAADVLALENIKCRVISLHTLKPFDRETIFEACSETRGVITVEENTVDGGLGSLVAEACLENGVVPGFFHRIGLREGFSCAVGSQEYLRKLYGMDSEAIIQAVKSKVLCYHR